MTRQEFIDELIRRFTDSVTEGMPDFIAVHETEKTNVFIGEKDGDYYFGHVISPFYPIVTFRKAIVKEIITEG